MQKPTRLVISSLVLVAILFSAIASGKPVPVVQAEQPEMNAEVDAFGNVVRSAEAAYNYVQEPSGEFSRETLDAEGNIIAGAPLSSDPFAGESDYAQLPADGPDPAPPASMENFLVDEWSLHLLDPAPGINGLNIGDINSDGILEIVIANSMSGDSHGDHHWFVLRQDGAGGYEPVYVSETSAAEIRQVLTADADGDGASEIYVVLSTRNLLVYDGRDYSLIRSFSLPVVPSSLVLADADGDGTMEIILSEGTTVFVYDPYSFHLLWQSAAEIGGSLAVGNVDADAGLEIVTSRGYVLDGVTRDVEWYYPSGFESHMMIGDVDGDGMAEIIGAARWYCITVFDVNPEFTTWQISTLRDIDAVFVADVNGDDRPEILYGDGQMGGIHAIDGLTQLELWTIANPDYNIGRIGVGDTDQDAQVELWWGSSSNLYAAGVMSQTIEWKSSNLVGPMYAVDSGDVDDDGQIEIVAVSYQSDTSDKDGVIHIIDAETHQLEWQSTDLPGILAWGGVKSIRIGDVDQDGQTEFVIATTNFHDGLIQIYDGKTHELERQSAEFEFSLTALELGDVDGDGKIEIVAGQKQDYSAVAEIPLVVMDGATAAVEWLDTLPDTGRGEIYDILLADVDQDGQVEIAASAKDGPVFVFDGTTHVLELKIETQAYALDSADLDADGIPSLLVGRENGSVDVYNGFSHEFENTYSLSADPVACLKIADLTLDEIPEWLACSGNRLKVYSLEGELLWQSRNMSVASSPGGYNQIPVGQIDSDVFVEVLVGSVDAVYQYEQQAASWFSRMTVSQSRAIPGDTLTYSIEFANTSVDEVVAASATNTLPVQLSLVPGSLSATDGSATFENGVIHWTGSLAALQTVTISYQAVVMKDFQLPVTIRNEAEVTVGAQEDSVSAETISSYSISMPVCFKGLPNGCTDFSDDFEDPASGWPVYTDSYARYEYVNGEYRMLAYNLDYFYMVKAPTCKRQNYQVDVDVRWISFPRSVYGLVFGLSSDFKRFYLFIVDPSYQKYALYYYDANGFQAINDFSRSYYISQKASNHLQVERNGSTIALSVNGYSLGKWTDERISGLTSVGFINIPNASSAEVHYDNFSVKHVEEKTAQPQLFSESFDAATDEVQPSWFMERLDFDWMAQDPSDRQ